MGEELRNRTHAKTKAKCSFWIWQSQCCCYVSMKIFGAEIESPKTILIALDEFLIGRHSKAAIVAAVKDDHGVTGTFDSCYIMIGQEGSVRS